MVNRALQTLVFMTVAAGGGIGAQDSSAQTLSLGDPAPELRVVKWDAGGPVDLASGKGSKIFVIEFWSPACPQSSVRLPALNRLQAKYADKNVVVVSIALSSPEEAQDFLEKYEIQLSHSMTCDDSQRNEKNYLDAVDTPALIYTFVTDKPGLIVWHGTPSRGMGDVVEAVLSGKYTVETGQEVERLRAMLYGALSAEQWTAAVRTLNRLIELYPNPFDFQVLKFHVLSSGMQDPKAAKTVGPAILKGMTHYLDLDDFARYLLGGEIGKEYYDLGLTFCEAAYHACQGKKKDIAHSFARAKFLNGDAQGAIELEKKALELAGGKDVFFQVTLEKYQKAARH